MNILSTEERAKLRTALENAPDEILIDAVNQYKDWRKRIADDFKALHGYLGIRVTELPTPKFPAASSTPTSHTPVPLPASDEAAPQQAVNKKPPGTACSRVGGTTKELILVKCCKPSTLEEINKHLSRGAGKLEETQSILKLLWERGDIAYDGSNYKLSK